MKRRAWEQWEIEAVQQLYPHVPTQEIATALRRGLTAIYKRAEQLGLEKTEAFRNSPLAYRLTGTDQRGMSARFPPGHVPANKGLRRPGYAPGRMAVTQFKKGSMSGAAQHNYVAIGSLRVVYGNLERKVTDDPAVYPARRWTPVHRLIWEAVNGPLPQGHVVVFKPGLRATVEAEITLDRIECITRAQLMQRNTIHMVLPPELRQLTQLRGALNRMINRRSKPHEEQDAGRARHSDQPDGSHS